LWLSEPDYAQHGSGPSSPTAKAALRSSDDNLAMVLAALDRAGVRDQTDVIVVSDHGFSTIERNIDLEAELKQAGFAAARKFDKGPAPGSVMVVGNGGEVSLYVIGHDEGVIERLVGFLQRSDFAGVIFTRKAMAGTFDMSQVKIDSETAPDIVVSMRWNDKVSKYGLPGEIVSEGLAKGPGQGNHTSLSKFDMHNTLVASGPDFKKEFVDDLPSGNVDVAPTVLALFGVTGEGMDGRVLREGFAEETSPVGKAEKTRVEAEAPVEGGMWKQYVVISSVEGRVYFDEGNGGVVGK